MTGETITGAIERLAAAPLTYAEGRDNTHFYSLVDIATAFEFDNDPCTVAVLFADDLNRVSEDARMFSDEFNNLCEFLKLLKENGGSFAFDRAVGKRDNYWGIAIPGGSS